MMISLFAAVDDADDRIVVHHERERQRREPSQVVIAPAHISSRFALQNIAQNAYFQKWTHKRLNVKAFLIASGL